MHNKKIGIITIYDNNNFGNRLQNYASHYYFTKLGYDVDTIVFESSKKAKVSRIIRESWISNILYYFSSSKLEHKRIYKFSKFTKKNIPTVYSLDKNKIEKQYSYFGIGSDQVWNPTFGLDNEIMFLNFTTPNKKICLSPSIAVSKLGDNMKVQYKNYLSTFNEISVREESGKQLIQELLPNKNVSVLIDPTMLLSPDEWDKVAKKPKQLHFEKYILNYFIGELSEERKKEIERVARDNNCEIINLLDRNDTFYTCNPAEFLYLEKHAFLICTDSFHSSVFSILYNRPFIVFEREDNHEKMNSRIDTLINKLKLENRRFNGKISSKNLIHDYSEGYKVLDTERRRYFDFLSLIIGEKNEK